MNRIIKIATILFQVGLTIGTIFILYMLFAMFDYQGGITNFVELTSKVTEFDRPNYFADEMVSGAFSEFKHEHHFADLNGGTLMTDFFDYKSPIGILGKLADKLFLEKYMTELLVERNRIVKEFAETEKWKNVIT